jgi:hypothetical protein
MSRLVRFVRLPAGDRRILLKAVLLLWAVRLGLWILPFQRLRDLLSKRKPGRLAVKRHSEMARVEKITRGVRLMSRYVPAATCLAQALVTVTLLEEAGCPACLRIGVARSNEGKLEAHAWVESLGKVVIGGTHVDLTRFTVLHAVEGI